MLSGVSDAIFCTHGNTSKMPLNIVKSMVSGLYN